ncbi:glycosyltransferase 61 family protein [Rhizosaccharibacter radicis]|uniref:Glycosyltransferase 61 family protein n=1 Tax=Rhizosaccharibacter radicis TaxID=2782605 RepID=A0ABT1W0Q9_9PROT|nr:glycosyltransferase 61 family protein [Acetobacteraceae bacterium KSS12]
MQRFIGFGEDALHYNRQYQITDATPGRAIVTDALVQGIRPTIPGNLLEELGGGAFDAAGIVPESLHPRSDGRNAVKPGQVRPAVAAANHIPRAVFGGVAFDHFGHFLLEGTTRLWALPDHADLPWIFLSDGAPRLKGYQSGFLQLLGLGADQIIVVNDAASVGELVVPAPSFTYHHHVTHAYRDSFRRARLPERDTPFRRVFLSRSQTTIALTVGERELEEVLRRDGWEIVIPERLPPAEQALLFRDNNLVMGLQGSAMHLGLFAPPGRRVCHLCRGQAYRGYYVLDDLMDADAVYFQAMSSPPLPSKPITGPFMLDLDATIDFLRAEQLLASAPVAGSAPDAGRRRMMERDYEAWWYYTDSQIRFHRQINHDGLPVTAESALEPAVTAARLRPDNGEIVSHATALTLKFRGENEAAEVLALGREALEGDTPATAQLLHFQSIIEDMRGHYPAAMAAAERAHRIDPGNQSYLNQLATTLFRLGRLEEAETLLRGVIASGRAIASNHYLLSILLESRGEMAEALTLAERAQQLDRGDEELLRRLVLLLRAAGRHEDAVQAQAAFLDRNPGSPPLLLEVAAHATGRGDHAGALKHLRQAYRQAPTDPVIADRFRDALLSLKQLPSLALLGMQPHAAAREHSIMIYRHSLGLAEAGQHEDALTVAIAAATMWPDNETIMQNVQKCLLAADRPAEARLLAADLVARGQETGPYLYVLSLAEGYLGRPQAARDSALRAAALAPDNPLIAGHAGRLAQVA